MFLRFLIFALKIDRSVISDAFLRKFKRALKLLLLTLDVLDDGIIFNDDPRQS